MKRLADYSLMLYAGFFLAYTVDRIGDAILIVASGCIILGRYLAARKRLLDEQDRLTARVEWLNTCLDEKRETILGLEHELAGKGGPN